MATQTLLRPLRPFSHPAATSIGIRTAARTYHSINHPPPPGPFTEIESSILKKAAPYIPSHGFTLSTLSLGAKEAGYIDATTNLFPKGAFSLVHWHLYSQRMGLRDVLEARKEELERKTIEERVRVLTWERLKGNGSVIGRLQEAFALSALPSNIPPTLSELAELSSEILYLANETSVDFSWYTRRVSLSSVYAASELFMTTDKSEGFGGTKEFMERRFHDAEGVKDVVGGVGTWVGFTAASVVNIARSKGVRI